MTKADRRKLCFLFMFFLPATVLCRGSTCEQKIPKMCDFIVVGLGNAGSVVASRLSEDPDVTVCGIEAGTRDTDQPLSSAAETPRLWTGLSGLEFSFNYTTVPQTGLNGRTFPVGMGKVLGGSTTIHGLAYFRGFKADFDRWAAGGATGWSYKDVLPFFLKSENNTSPLLQNSGFHNYCGPLTISQNLQMRDTPLFKLLSKSATEDGLPEKDCNEPSPFGICQFQWTVRSGQRESSSTAFLRTAMRKKNLHMVTEAFAEKILISRKRAKGVIFFKDGRRYFVHANKEIIVSCGTFDSATLLQRSGIGPSNLLRKLKIRQHANLPVGENYHDHVVNPMELLLNIPTLRFNDLTKSKVLKEYIFNRTGLYAHATGVQSIFLDNRKETLNRPEIQIGFSDGRFSSLFTSSDIKSEDFIQRDMPSKNGTTVIFILAQPRSRGIVKIRSRNPLVPPFIDPSLLTDRRDVINMIQGMRQLQRLIQRPSMKEVGATLNIENCDGLVPNSNEDLECFLRTNGGPEIHPVGTCKMGRVCDPSTVVDPKLRVKGITRLRVVDNSIMPDITSANTQGPAYMIGERGADFILTESKQKY